MSIYNEKVNVNECKYYYNGKCERYEKYVDAPYADYSVICTCADEGDFEYDVCEYQLCERLEKENEKIKKQYNCYACNNCGGKEDYINLAKHHLGLRKQFDEFVKRNNTLSLRIEDIKKENEELKKGNDYLMEVVNESIIEQEKLVAKVNRNRLKVNKLHKALEEIRKIAKENKYLAQYKSICGVILNKINEVLNERD